MTNHDKFWLTQDSDHTYRQDRIKKPFTTRPFRSRAQTVITEMPFHSIFNSAEAITCSRHVTINRFLLAQSALDLSHFTRYFQRN